MIDRSAAVGSIGSVGSVGSIGSIPRAARAWLVALFACLALVASVVAAPVAHADDAPPDLFRRGSAALARGEYEAAIDAFEALADRGFVHPDASFDRGLAYLARVKARADHPGDLGRAAAGFQEALELRPSDPDADAALDTVRAEVARRRSRRAKDAVDVRPTLDRVVVRLASERTWAGLALGASMLLAVGLVLRKRPGAAHVAGSVLAPAAGVAVLVLSPLTYAARELSRSTHAGVVVVPELYLQSETGQSLGGDPIPEAASVEVGERRGGLVAVRWGATEGFAPPSSVRVLASR
jgi:hypothetical protein